MMASAHSNMSEEDRLALAAKLDRELDEFIDGLEKKRYEDGWPEDRWEEEMAKHPFFMKQAPNPESTETLSPLAEGLQRLKYDPDENTAEELAQNYKEDGNFNFKYKNYRMAIIGYTEGLKIKCDDIEINAGLYNNRSASHYFLGNYRSSLEDAKKALKLKPGHFKALARAAECALKISDFDLCTEYCDQILKANKLDENANKLKVDAANRKAIYERDQRKKLYLDKKKKDLETDIIKAISSRGIKTEIRATEDSLTLSDLEPTFPGVADCCVHWNSTRDELIWPVLFLYPEYEMTDFIQQSSESTILQDHLNEVFQSTPEWDKDGSYHPNRLSVYYEGPGKYKLFFVDTQKTLLEIMKEPTFELRAGTPAFIIFVKNSRTEEAFVNSYK